MLSNCSSYKNWWDSYESKAVVSFQLIYFYMYTYYWGHACFHLKLCSKQILNMTEQIASHFLEYLKNNKRQAALHCKHNMLQHLRAESQLTRLGVTPVKWLLLSVCSLTLPEVNPSFPTFPLFLHLFFFFSFLPLFLSPFLSFLSPIPTVTVVLQLEKLSWWKWEGKQTGKEVPLSAQMRPWGPGCTTATGATATLGHQGRFSWYRMPMGQSRDKILTGTGTFMWKNGM